MNVLFLVLVARVHCKFVLMVNDFFCDTDGAAANALMLLDASVWQVFDQFDKCMVQVHVIYLHHGCRGWLTMS